jgi:hypothetical protein
MHCLNTHHQFLRQMMSDLVNNLAMHNFCRSITQKPGAHVWHFLFDHFNPDSSRALNRLLPFKASTHGNELHYVFDINFFVLPWRRTQADRAVLDMTTRWARIFADQIPELPPDQCLISSDGGQTLPNTGTRMASLVRKCRRRWRREQEWHHNHRPSCTGKR